jgi:hypothetical protein
MSPTVLAIACTPTVLDPRPMTRPNVYVTGLWIATRISPPLMRMPLWRYDASPAWPVS